MGRAACADIHTGDRHEARLSLDLDLTAVIDLRELAVFRIGYLSLEVLIYNPVCFPLKKKDLLLVQLAVHIECHRIVAEVKSDIVKPVPVVHEPGQNMLPCVVLHKSEPSLPVNVKDHFAAALQTAVLYGIRALICVPRYVTDHAVLDLYVRHFKGRNTSVNITVFREDPSDVSGLSAAFGKKYSLIRDHFDPMDPFVIFISGQLAHIKDDRLTSGQICICLV